MTVASTTRPRKPAPTHACPGDCGQHVPQRLLACDSCWWLLPAPQRDEIRRATGMDRLRLIGDALIWFRENVKDGEFVGD